MSNASKPAASRADASRKQTVNDLIKNALDQEETRVLAERIFYASSFHREGTLYPRTLAVFSPVLSEN